MVTPVTALSIGSDHPLNLFRLGSSVSVGANKSNFLTALVWTPDPTHEEGSGK